MSGADLHTPRPERNARRDTAKRADNGRRRAGPQLLGCGLHRGVAYTVDLGTGSSMTEAKLTMGHIARAAGVNSESIRTRAGDWRGTMVAIALTPLRSCQP